METKQIIEAIVFAAGRPVGIDEILAALEIVVPGPRANRREIEDFLGTLQKEYQERGGGIELVTVAGGWEFRTVPGMGPWMATLNRPKPQRLTTSAVETMALVAYRQPVTRGEIESVRGVDSGAVLGGLLDRRLVRIIGRKEEPGRPFLYATTREFLELFGLKDLGDLPPLKEFEERVKSAGVTVSEGAEEFTLSDLATNPEVLASLEEADRELLGELDESLQELKTKEKELY